MKVKILIVVIFSLFSTFLRAEQIADVHVNRAWGLLIGDEVTFQIDLPIATSKLDLSSLPETQARYGAWLYLKDRSVQKYSLSLTYQIVNVPNGNTQVMSPEFNLRTLNDEWIKVPAVPMIIGSFLPKDDKNIVMKPDHAPVLVETQEIKNKIWLFGFMAIVSALILVIWHIGWRPKNRKPFAEAVHLLARYKWHKTTTQNQALRILHAAFNNTANTIVVNKNIDVLFQQAPWLRPLEKEVTEFYIASSQYFFSQDIQHAPDLEMILKLAKACRAKEKLS